MVRKKGQVVFEFVIAALVLFGLIFYSMNYVARDFDARHDSFRNDILESTVMRVSGYLLNSENGIVDEWPVLSASKMDYMENNICDDFTNYEPLLQELGLKQTTPYERFTYLNVVVTDTDGTVYNVCPLRTPPDRSRQATVTRYAVAPGDKLAEVRITVWE